MEMKKENIMRRLTLIIAAVAALGILAVAAAAPISQNYSFSGPDGSFTFDVQRSEPSGEVVWVSNRCVDASGNPTYTGFDYPGSDGPREDQPVVWGTFDSLDGTAGPFSIPAGSVECTAYLTFTPWNAKHNDPSITYSP